ncbi:MAG: hypothetical protein H7Z72_26280, partial [Bacteroidetes bacterium]|nr:hypothetical protein [Fibrella sp.]
MNQTFSLARFAQLNRWFWATNGRTYTLGMLALLSITVFLLARVLIINGYDANITQNNVVGFNLLSLTAISLLSCHIVSVLHDQNSALLYLMLPASRTEKFTLTIVYFIAFIISYTLFFQIAETLILRIANSRLPASGNLYRPQIIQLNERVSDMARVAYGLLMIAVVGLLSSFYFRQGVLIKNTVLIFCLIPGSTIVYGYLIGAFFPGLETHTSNLFGGMYVHPKGEYANA